MYIPKGTTISYRIVKVKCEGVEKEMVLTDKDVFESLVTKLGFEKKEEREENKDKEQIQEQTKG